jgi:hypothetical protein
MKKVDTDKANGTYLQGQLVAKYEDLVKVFGEPNDGPNSPDIDKSTCEWVLEYKDNGYCTIYDWKVPETIYEPYAWHIGGNEEDCMPIVSKFFKDNL